VEGHVYQQTVVSVS